MDPYDEIDSRFASDEKTYEEIWKEEVYPNLSEEDQEEYGEIYEGKTDQDHLIYERCDNNDCWYDDYYQIAIQNCFNY